MAVTGLTTIKCSCGQTIFADAPKCQFCGRANAAAAPTNSRGNSGAQFTEVSESASTMVTVSAVYWLIYNGLAVYGGIQEKLAADALHAKNKNYEGGNTAGFGMGLIFVLSLAVVAFGMLSKTPSSLRKAYVISIIGSIVLTPVALAACAVAVSSEPRLMFGAIFTLIGAFMTFVTRWAVKRV